MTPKFHHSIILLFLCALCASVVQTHAQLKDMHKTEREARLLRIDDANGSIRLPPTPAARRSLPEMNPVSLTLR
jgi:hypothetical protein